MQRLAVHELKLGIYVIAHGRLPRPFIPVLSIAIGMSFAATDRTVPTM